MPKKKNVPCGFEVVSPHMSPVSCPACGFVFGKGGFLDVSNPCFNQDSWPNKDCIVLENVRIDKTGTIVPKFFHPHKCEQCAKNLRDVKNHGVWLGEERRHKSTVKKVDIDLTGAGDD